MCGALNDAGFGFVPPQGAYYVMADISSFGYADDIAFADFLVKDIGVAVVPGSSFYSGAGRGARRGR